MSYVNVFYSTYILFIDIIINSDVFHSLSQDQNIAQLITSRIVDGSIYCEVERPANVKISNIDFDMTEEKFYLLLASGTGLNADSIAYHDLVYVHTKYATLFEEGKGDIFEGAGNSKVLLFLHAVFMIIAWIFFSAIGILSARFGKSQLRGLKMFGKDLWFVIHQICMTIVWLLVIASVAIIWIDVGTWRTSAHSITGIISSSLCVVQPFVAALRPSPSHEMRPIFNFLHGSIGKFAQLFAGKINESSISLVIVNKRKLNLSSFQLIFYII